MSEQLQEELASHVMGTLHCLQEAARVMRGGRIIVIGSVASTMTLPDCAGYGAAKAAQRALVLSAAKELSGIDVTLLQVGAVDTSMWNQRPSFDRTKMLRPEDIAARVVALAQSPSVPLEETMLPPAGVLP
jgi:NAD(P)-dependent dehydrogenase (short-subunit alcohol dehydrogenase family)